MRPNFSFASPRYAICPSGNCGLCDRNNKKTRVYCNPREVRTRRNQCYCDRKTGNYATMASGKWPMSCREGYLVFCRGKDQNQNQNQNRNPNSNLLLMKNRPPLNYPN